MFRTTNKPFKRALLIGIDYIDTPIRLKGCINDVNTIRQYLMRECDYSPFNIRMLTDTGFKPTLRNIINSINWFVSGLRAGDTLFFYYSGHGTSVLDRNGDEIDKKDEALVPLDYTMSGVLLDDWIFTNFIKRIPQNVTLYSFFDCCCSGTMTDIKYNIRYLPEPKPSIVEAIKSYISNDWNNNYLVSIEGKEEGVNGNIFVFSGCLDSEVAIETVNTQNQPQGAFTKVLLETLINNNNKIKLIEFNKELNCRLFYSGYRNQNSQLSISGLNLLDFTVHI